MFRPKRVLIEEEALNYELGRQLHQQFEESNVELIQLKGNRTRGIPGENSYEKYREGKATLVIGVRKSFTLQTCKPSAHYQLPLVTGCMGQCEYCYLNTQLGDKPYTRVYVNIEEILQNAKKYIDKVDDITIFEGAATSDPIPVEPYTHALEKTIEFFSKEPKGLFRFVTKYTNISELLTIAHNGRTTVRFSINTDHVINKYEHKTPSANKRMEAASKMVEAGYPIGFLVAPVFLYDDYQLDYKILLSDLRKKIKESYDEKITFEIISHRYTTKAKNRIEAIFPETTLPMKDEDRKFKYGQFGYGKFVYRKEELEDMKDFFKNELQNLFRRSEVKYMI